VSDPNPDLPPRSILRKAQLFAHRRMLGMLARRRWRDGNGGDPAKIRPGARIPFICNLCGTPNAGTLAQLSREALTCTHCGSNVRFRAMGYLVTREVLGRAIALPDFAENKAITGIGLSDAEAYAKPLSHKFSYANTFYHMEPRLDIAGSSSPRDWWSSRLPVESSTCWRRGVPSRLHPRRWAHQSRICRSRS